MDDTGGRGGQVRGLEPFMATKKKSWKNWSFLLLLYVFDCAFMCRVVESFPISVRDGQQTPVFGSRRDVVFSNKIYLDVGNNGTYILYAFGHLVTLFRHLNCQGTFIRPVLVCCTLSDC